MTRGIGGEKTPDSARRWRCCRSMSRKPLLFFLALVVLVGASVLLVKMRNNAIESVRCSKCQHSLKAIGLALRGYNSMDGSLPPACLCDKDGKAVNSWRLLVADVIFYHRNVSLGYDVTQPPNSPGNSQFRLADQTIEEFQCPSATEQGPKVTNYVAVVGPNTMWPGCAPAKPAANGSDNDKILVIEVIHSDILWMEPRDLTLEQALDAVQPKMGVGIGSQHKDGIHYVTVGGEVRTLDRNIDRESLRKLLVRDSPQVPAGPNNSKPDPQDFPVGSK